MLFQDQIKLALDKSNLEDFTFKDCIIGDDECVLVNPIHIGAKWNKNNLIFRSCIYRKNDYHPISLGYSKFFNNSESPNCYPDFGRYKDWSIGNKLDGSLILTSCYKGSYVIRTRGTSDIFVHSTANEIVKLLDDTNLYSHNLFLSEKYTFLFEHITPNNQIVIKYDKPELVLLDIVRNEDYCMMPISFVDEVAKSINIQRPARFNFKSINDIVKNCETLKNAEGYVLSYNDNQNRIKIKSLWYLYLHRLKSELSSIDKVIDLWAEMNYPKYEEFYNHIRKVFDFELAEQCKNYISQICDGKKEVDRILDFMENCVKSLGGQSRKEQAEKIIQAYGKTNRASFAFKMLDGKFLDKNDIKKLLYQCIKK